MATHDETNANIISFINSDPLSCGVHTYAVAHPGDDPGIMNIVNSTISPGAGPVAADPINSADFFDLIDGDDFNAMTNAQLQQLSTIMSVGSVNMGSTATQNKLDALLANFATSRVAVQANYTRQGSPWEVWFGKGHAASQQSLDDARNSGSGNNF